MTDRTRFVRRARTLAVTAGLCLAVATACAPPPPTPEWMTERCYEGVDATQVGFVYHGPVNTRFNATGYLEGGGTCAGSGLRTGNVVRADTEALAEDICRSILEPDFTVSGATDLDTTHVDVPADAWICRFGP